MEKEFVPYGLALRMKDLGFDEPCFVTMDQTGFMHLKGTEYPIRGSMVYHEVNVPTWQSAFRWFREKYKLSHIWIMDELLDTGEYTYEEAERACLEKLIEIVEEI
jgi:hypothetical protein